VIVAVDRDSEGKFLGASLVVLQGISEPETLEAMACREVWFWRRSYSSAGQGRLRLS
jgi:hypothetical protein